MATQYGNENEPGVITLLESELSVNVSSESPATPILVGPADLANGSASAGDVVEVGNATGARNAFGSDSPLTRNVNDALAEGAQPVFGVPVEPVDVTAEDLSGLSSNSDTLAEAPVEEDAGSITFSVNGTDLTTVLVYEDPVPADAGTDEVLVEPTSGKFAIDDAITVGNTGDEVDYTYHNYTTAVENATSGETAEEIDLIAPLTENESVQTNVELEVDDMASKQEYAVGYFPAEVNIPDTSTYDPAFDNMRVQLEYPTRDDNEHIIGAYVGLRARLGINATAIKRRLTTHTTLDKRLTAEQRGNLIDNRVVPVMSSSRGAQIRDDRNTVDPAQNEDEANVRFAYSTHVADYLTGVIEGAEEDFIGDLHRPAIQTALDATLTSRLRELQKSAQLVGFTTDVEGVSSTKVNVEVGLDLADPLRFIENNIVIEE